MLGDRPNSPLDPALHSGTIASRSVEAKQP